MIFRSAAGSVDPVDGYVERASVSESFATLRAGNGNNFVNDGTGVTVRLTAAGSSDLYFELRRAILVFDTSPIPATAVILAAKLSLVGASKTSDLGPTSITITQGVSASNSALAMGDYQSNLSTVSFASITIADLSVSGRNDFVFNPAGLAAIAKGPGARTKLAVRLDWDVTGVATGLVWANGLTTGFGFLMADTVGTGSDPELTVQLADPGFMLNYHR